MRTIWKDAFVKAADNINQCNEEVKELKKDVASKTRRIPEHGNFCKSKNLAPIMQAIIKAQDSHVIHYEEVLDGCIMAREAIGYLEDIVLAQFKYADCYEHDLYKQYVDFLRACKKASNTLFAPYVELSNAIDKFKGGDK